MALVILFLIGVVRMLLDIVIRAVAIAKVRGCGWWLNHLPCVLLGLRLAAREDNNTTPAQAVFGSPLILPGQFLDSPELLSVKFLEQFLKH
jgi:hypothetical protein